jgi:hypothetical protein
VFGSIVSHIFLDITTYMILFCIPEEKCAEGYRAVDEK